MKLDPLLAGTVKETAALARLIESPGLVATVKIDGIRCITLSETEASEVGILVGPGAQSLPVSRKLKPIPNDHVRGLLATLPPHLDGELLIPGAANFGEVSGPIMRKAGAPVFEYLLFDYRAYPLLTYVDRLEQLATLLQWLPAWCRVLAPTHIKSLEQLDEYEAAALAAGHEGVMLRRADGRYKHGRSTEREAILLKMKRFEQLEAEIVDAVELQRNGNEQERDALGHAKRSSAKEGKTAGGMLGALVCTGIGAFVDIEFQIGSGYTETQRRELWDMHQRGELCGHLVRYKAQPIGGQERPRFPVFEALRHRDDT